MIRWLFATSLCLLICLNGCAEPPSYRTEHLAFIGTVGAAEWQHTIDVLRQHGIDSSFAGSLGDIEIFVPQSKGAEAVRVLTADKAANGTTFSTELHELSAGNNSR